MSYLLYSQLNTLQPFSLIAGTEYTLEYTVYESDGVNPVDITAGTAKIIVFRYGNPSNVIIEKTATISGSETGKFSVTLNTSDTISLSGKFVHQPVYVDFSGTEFRLAQGEFIILAAGQ